MAEARDDMTAPMMSSVIVASKAPRAADRRFIESQGLVARRASS